ncbi:MAG: DUF167 family protein [Devosia sp.]
MSETNGAGADVPAFVRFAGSALLIDVRATPGARQDSVEGALALADGTVRLAVKVRAAPENGRANKALETLLANHYGLAKGDVRVVKGTTSRLKTVRLEGDPAALVARMEQQVTP